MYLILEFVDKGDLFKQLQRNGGTFSESVTKNYIVQVASAVDYLHSRHVYHRDIKPENILIDGKDQLKLSDFGWAVHAWPNKESLRYTLCGTPEYLSPEMILQTGHNEGVDLWALGILLHEMLTGW